eukprot:TRINITY_DN12812_c0_g1_i20.p4 TRINITY_DN12812_c0_g1~~TRINITY_DN12812_c0_g1_i20.p4  ORF type:complete len:102 (-),score=23.45 TRINITY_DN12812_c0_g1_i20:168-473(-)
MESTGSAKKFEIKKWNAVALWAWDIQTDVCSICRGQLMEPCIPFLTLGIECQANPGANEECTVAWGACNHSFHWHCISRWIKTRNTCPLDNNNWELQRLGK